MPNKTALVLRGQAQRDACCKNILAQIFDIYRDSIAPQYVAWIGGINEVTALLADFRNIVKSGIFNGVAKLLRLSREDAANADARKMSEADTVPFFATKREDRHGVDVQTRIGRSEIA
ncbi:hypothetical protein KSF73_09225 [Burkholderiaceae bacterium DAT-1]|nr:hypothetical protein [Burkholderiaceae bacterium DAT-1]